VRNEEEEQEKRDKGRNTNWAATIRKGYNMLGWNQLNFRCFGHHLTLLNCSIKLFFWDLKPRLCAISPRPRLDSAELNWDFWFATTLSNPCVFKAVYMINLSIKQIYRLLYRLEIVFPLCVRVCACNYYKTYLAYLCKKILFVQETFLIDET